jgi:hypothetical protein
MILEFSRQIFEKYSKVKINHNPSSGGGVVPCLQTDGRTDITKLKVAFRSFTNAPKNRRAESVPVFINPYPSNVENIVSS